jgi:tetratricopeptide (TPR) repeat protein
MKLWLFIAAAAVASASGPNVENEAVAFHEARSQSRAEDGDAHRLLASALLKRAEATGSAVDYDRAWASLQTAERLEPGELRTLIGRARVLTSRHRFTQAWALIEAGLRKHPSNLDLLAMAGDVRLEVGDLAGAERYFRELPKRSERLFSYSRMSGLEEANGNLAEAAKWMERALQLGQRQGESQETIGWARAVLGELYLKLDRTADARSTYETGLRDAPGHPLLMEHLAELETIEGHVEASVALYRRILALGRPDPENKLRLAAILMRAGEEEEAVRLRREAREFCRNAVMAGNEGYLRPLATLYLEEERYSDAASLAAADVALRPTRDSRELLEKVLAAAVEAGKPVSGELTRTRP